MNISKPETTKTQPVAAKAPMVSLRNRYGSVGSVPSSSDENMRCAFSMSRNNFQRLVYWFSQILGKPDTPFADAELSSVLIYFVFLVPRGGIEPPTLRFSVACSTN